MSSTIQRLTKQQKIRPPSWLPDNVRYETVMGSNCYGVSTDDSDWDMVGFYVPPKDVVFPHLAGIIPGFGRQQQKFVCYQQHHVRVEEERKTYDLNSYNIVHYFHLCMDNNPNMIDSLFVPRECIIHSSKISEMVREKRRMFLHKGAWHRFKGYAYAQLHKMGNKKPEGKRLAIVEKFGFDVKFAYHLVRLLGEIEQILTEGDIDLRRNREHLKAIRRGDVAEADIRKWAAEKEHTLEKVYNESNVIPYKPDEEAIKQLLLDCLEEHFGTLTGCVFTDNQPVVVLRELTAIIDKNRGLIA
ncbi:MAG: nucleotidyltransferase domain-containing protein [Planctomycetota bacterium]|jgi:predicted nucleotidyltransferase